MIRKIVTLKNVGRFLNYAYHGDMELRHYNLFFAENGRGKTTLCAIMRSLQTSKPEYITERETLGGTGKPEVKILLDTKEVVIFDGKKWNKSHPLIEIFDSTFIATNVFVGEYVDLEQKRNLYRVIIGSQGIALTSEVGRLDEAIRAKNIEIGVRKATLQQQAPRSLKDIDAFVNIASDPDVEAKILDKTVEQQAARRATEIKIKGLLSSLHIPTFSGNLEVALLKGIEGIGEDAEKRLASQIEVHHMHEKGEEWISEGVGYIHSDRCPFCGQGISSNDLVAAYRAFFSAAYHQLRNEIADLKTSIEVDFGTKPLSDIEKSLIQNDAAIEFWKQFVTIDLPPLDFDKDVGKPLNDWAEAALALLAKKASSPLEEVTPDAAFAPKRVAVQDALSKLALYNTAIAAANAFIQDKKVKTQTLNELTVQAALEELQIVRHRHTPEVAALCVQYQNALSDKKTLEGQKTTAKENLDKHTESIITHYEKRINDLLNGFNAGFTIANIRHNYPGGTASSTYQILINGTPVEVGDSKTPLGTPSFRNTLSAGDKNTLAFAFFLAQLEQTDKKAEKIVVFDDPFNSQDRSRRTRTKELIKKCGQECRQIFVFSHDPYFLKYLSQSLPYAEERILQLSRVGLQNTAIEEWDIEKETKGGYFQDHAALTAYLQDSSKDLRDIARKIRPVLEGYCRYRFPGQFTDKEWLGDMLEKIKAKGSDHQLFDVLEKLQSINDYSKKYHHDSNHAKADTEIIDDGELQSFVKLTLNIVGGY
ncbi:MAG: AAA family ATPase [Nitrospira sp.]|nr:MAG: AAA family ATPase [Nitrospira sp.]